MLTSIVLLPLGVVLGTITGLVPGIHVNTICLWGLLCYRRVGLDGVDFATVIVSMSITHTFMDFLPAIFMGVPEEETALGILPTHRLVQEGRALDAVRLTAFGSLSGFLISLALCLPAVYVSKTVFYLIRPWLGYLLLGFCIMLFLKEGDARRVLDAVFVFTLSGTFGVAVLDSGLVSKTYVLMPVFTGMFGLPIIIYSLGQKTCLPEQKPYSTFKADASKIKASVAGTLGGAMVGFLPAMSPSQVGMLLTRVYGGSTTGFLTAVASTNTADAVFSLITLYTIGNPRSGASVTISNIMQTDIYTTLYLIGVMAVSSSIAYHLQIILGKHMIRMVNAIDYQKLMAYTLAFMILAIYSLTGGYGLLIAGVATMLGFIAQKAGVSRTHLMGVLLVPTIGYYMG